MASKIQVTRICKFCQNGFTAYTTTTKYCSKQCSAKAIKEEIRNKKIEASNKETRDIISITYEKIKVKEFLSISEASKLFGISRSTIYRMIERKELSTAKAGKRTILKRTDFDNLFDIPKIVKPRNQQPVTQFYTVDEIEDIFHIKYGRLNTIINKNNIPKTVHNGRLHVSKPHLDRYFKRNRQDVSSITKWYTVEEIQKKYNFSREQVYTRVSKYNLPKKRMGKFVKVSKIHFDELFEFGV